MAIILQNKRFQVMISAMLSMNMKRKYSSPDSAIVGLFIYGFITVLGFNRVFFRSFVFV
jgi:hypothetical protein